MEASCGAVLQKAVSLGLTNCHLLVVQGRTMVEVFQGKHNTILSCPPQMLVSELKKGYEGELLSIIMIIGEAAHGKFQSVMEDSCSKKLVGWQVV